MFYRTNSFQNESTQGHPNIFKQYSSKQKSEEQLMRLVFADHQQNLQCSPEIWNVPFLQDPRTPPQRNFQKTRSLLNKNKRSQQVSSFNQNKKELFKKKNNEKVGKIQRNFDSPKKTIKKFEISQNIVKQLQFKPKKIKQNINNQKELVVRNIFYREHRYFYSDQVVFSEILKRIYYQSWKISDMRNYIQPCFKVIKNQREFFEILTTEAGLFGDSIKKLLIKQISKVLVQNDDQNHTLIFKKFNKNLQKYNKTIDYLHSHYKHLESINIQIERLIQIYFQNFVKEQSELTEEEFKCHRRIFIDCVYNDQLIRNFINTFYKFLSEQRAFNCDNPSFQYQRAFEQVEEIFENLEPTSEILTSSQTTQNSNENFGQPQYLYDLMQPTTEMLSQSQSVQTSNSKSCDSSDTFSRQMYESEIRNFETEGDFVHMEEQEERKRVKRREKRKKRKEKKKQKNLEEKMIENDIKDQAQALDMQKRLSKIKKEFEGVKFQKIKIQNIFVNQSSSNNNNFN